MAEFSKTSLQRLSTCHPDLQALFSAVVLHYDCLILEGERTIEQQVLNVEKGVSKTLNSKHVHSPSLAVDVAPYPLDWNNRERFVHFQGFVKGMATAMGISIRQGIDWDGDNELKDQTFFDLPHVELVVK